MDGVPSVPTMALLTGAGAVATCIAVNRSAASSSEAVQQEHLKRTPSVIDGQVEHTLPRLQAGKLHDLEMCYLSWRDVRPYHLPGCSCSVCRPDTPHASPRPMEPRSDALVPLIAATSPVAPTPGRTTGRGQATQKISSDYYYAEIPPSEFGAPCPRPPCAPPPPGTPAIDARWGVRSCRLPPVPKAPGPTLQGLRGLPHDAPGAHVVLENHGQRDPAGSAPAGGCAVRER